MKIKRWIAPAMVALLTGCQTPGEQTYYDLLIENASIYDGLGSTAQAGEIAIIGDRIAYIGPDAPFQSKQVIDAHGLAVAPGFINMLSWSNEALFEDGTGESSLRQGITLEVMGEGISMAPLTGPMAAALKAQQGEIQYDVNWRSLDEYFKEMERRGVAFNIASYAGAATVRMNVLGTDDVVPTDAQMQEMQDVVRDAMEDGAMGVASSLIYPPGAFAETPELTALASQSAKCGGIYATHMRSEGDRWIEAIEEAITIGRGSKAPLELFHLKVGGAKNFPKTTEALKMMDDARADGVHLTADMYVYNASGTTLAASIPPWVQDGGLDAMLGSLQDPDTRAKIIAEMKDPDAGWENVMELAGGPDNVMLAVAKSAELKPYLGMRVSEIAEAWGVSPEEAILDLILKEKGHPEAIYFTMSEDSIREIIQKPYVSFVSDGVAMAPEGVFLESGTHPRSYGNFSRVYAHYVRDENLLSLPEAIRRMTSLPAGVLSLEDRGVLKEGNVADIVIFDPETIQDKATYLEPHQFSVGVDAVIVNGQAALQDGEPTGAMPGKALRGRAWSERSDGGCRASADDWTWSDN
ncbi:hypothetical protein HY29_01150 [Hyphomonas beringensis]|uniref:Amidohydrolase 3 domain-containing protein n=1 Tax=Hyphomonas beringensis TaxID=1280946 RepID=A0A062UI18_9PROT|nr:D-aminoacylase [Hyphomonas beringensis]KCZ57363.1 hypothetical protein HY29_01150 [Hyphomonas beringensis]